MKFDFESVIDRHGRDAIAIDAPGKPNGFVPGKPRDGFSLIPMWVADMNFATAPSVTEAVIERASHPLFGYFSYSDAYYDSIISWQKRRNGASPDRECVGYENGVLGCLASALRAFTSPGSGVLLHSPAYVGFSNSIAGSGRKAVLSPLYRDAEGVWRMDYNDMERVLADNKIHFAVFCSPHNPTGRVWEREELERATEIFAKYDVTVFSDEIWSDIILGDNKFIPTQLVSEDAARRTIAVYAPSKTFNLAGLIGSYHIVYDKRLRDLLRNESGITHYNNMNVLSQHALTGAYSAEGELWVDELRAVLTENVRYAYDFITSRFRGVRLSEPQGTYMLYLDLGEYLSSTGRTLDSVLASGWDVGVAWQDGRPFLNPDTIRVNLALPKSLVIEAFDRLEKYVF